MSIAAVKYSTPSGNALRGNRSVRQARSRVCNSASCHLLGTIGTHHTNLSSLPAEEVERFVVPQLKSLTVDEDLFRETCNRVRRLIDAERQRMPDQSMNSTDPRGCSLWGCG